MQVVYALQVYLCNNVVMYNTFQNKIIKGLSISVHLHVSQDVFCTPSEGYSRGLELHFYKVGRFVRKKVVKFEAAEARWMY